MLRFDLLLTPRITPPLPHRRVLARPRVLARLLEALDYRVAIVQAGTSCDKTTAVAALQVEAAPLFWYTLDESDQDPQQFLTYQIAAIRMQLPEATERPLALLGELGNDVPTSPL